MDESNLLVVSEYPIKRPYESYKPDEFTPFVDATVRAIARASDLKVTNSDREKLGPLDAYSYELEGPDGNGSKMILGFKGKVQYFLRCNWLAGDGADRIPPACDRRARASSSSPTARKAPRTRKTRHWAGLCVGRSMGGEEG